MKIFFSTSLLIFLLCDCLYAQLSVERVQLDESLRQEVVVEALDDLGIGENALLDSTRLEQQRRELQNLLYEQGYLFVRIDSLTHSISEAQRADIFVYGSLGAQVLFGDVKVVSDSIAASNYERIISVRRFDPFNRGRLESDLEQMLKLAADSGHVFASAHIGNAQLREDDGVLADVLIRVREGEQVTIDRIEVRGNSYTRENVILRELPFSEGARFNRRRVESVPRRLERLNIFRDVKTPQLQLDPQGRHILLLQVEEGNATTFDGVIGYIPETGAQPPGDGFFTGLIDISFKNLFGTARAFDVHWEKTDRLSEFFSLQYTEPWVGGIPLDAQFGLQRTLRDSTYLEWRSAVNGRYRYSENLSFLAGFSRLVVLPDSVASRDLRLLRYAQNNIEVGVEYDTRDYLLNPRGGVFYHTTYSSGFKENFGPSYLFREDSVSQSETVETIRLQFRWYYELFRNQVLAFYFTGNSIRGERLQLTDFFWFGGARTLRGYRENQFRGDIAAWINLEYRFLLGRNSRLFVFNDWGAWRFPTATETIEEIKPGYGIGIRLDTGLGVLGVDFGLGEGDSFSQAKIHFGIVNRF